MGAALLLATNLTNAGEIFTNYANDNGGRITSITYPAATAENVTYTYDSTASGNKKYWPPYKCHGPIGLHLLGL